MSPIFHPKLEEQKKRSLLKFGPIFRPKLGEEQKIQNKKKGLHSNLVQFFAQNQVKSQKKRKNRSSLKFGPIFRPKLGEEQKLKKRSSLKFGPIFHPNVDASLNKTHKTLPFV